MRLLRKLSNVSNDVLRKIVDQAVELSDAPKVDDAEFERRIAICEGCENFDKENRKCQLCGCFMDVKAELLDLPIVLPGMEKTVKCADKVNTRW